MGQDDLSQRPSRGRYFVVAGLSALALLTYVQRVGFANAGTALKDEMGLSPSEWGDVMTAFLISYALFEVPWGMVGDRLGTRHLLAVLVLGWSLSTAALVLLTLLPPSATSTFLLLLTLRFVFGMFQAGGFPAISRVMTDWVPVAERATAVDLIWALSRSGGALAPYVRLTGSGGMTDWFSTFLLFGALGVAWCAAFWPWFRDRPEQASWVNAAERDLIAGGRRPPLHRHASPLALLGSRNAWALCLMYGFGGLSATFFITLLPAYLKGQRGLSGDEMRLLSALPLACGVVGCLSGGVISDGIIRRWGDRKWGRRLCGMFGHTCAGLALLSTNLVEGVWPLAALLCLTFFCNDLAMGPAWACCGDIGEANAGTLGGAMNMVGNLGAALGTQIAGRLFDEVLPLSAGMTVPGNDLVFVVFACSFWLAALCWLGVDATRTLASEKTSPDFHSTRQDAPR